MEHSKGDGADQIVIHKDYDDDSDYSNDCEDDNRMETDDDDPHARQIVVHSSQAGTSTDVTCTSFEHGDGHEYDASVEQILVEFRRQAHALMGAQIQLHNRQTVNQEQVLSIFQFFSEAQVAIQQQNEFRLQSALADSQAQAAAKTQSLVESASFTVKHQIDQNLQLAINNAWVNALAPIESSAKDRVRNFAEGLGKELDNSIRLVFESGKSEALVNLKAQLIEILSEAERHIQTTVSAAIASQSKSNTAVNPATMKLIQDFRQQTDIALQTRIESVVVKQASSSTTSITAALTQVFDAQIKSGLDHLHARALAQAETTAIDRVDKRSQEIEQRLLEHFQAELARYSKNKQAVQADSSVIQSQVTATIALAMESLEASVDRRRRSVRAKALHKAEATASGYVDQRAKETEQKLQEFLVQKIAEMQVGARAPASTPEDLQQHIKDAVNQAMLLLQVEKDHHAQAQASREPTSTNSTVVVKDEKLLSASNGGENESSTSTHVDVASSTYKQPHAASESPLANDPALAFSREVKNVFSGILSNALQKAQVQFDAHEVIQKDLTEMQRRVKEKAAADNAKRMSYLPIEVQRKLRQIVKEMSSE